MKTQTRKPEQIQRTIQKKLNQNQPEVGVVLQNYKNKTTQLYTSEDEDVIQGKFKVGQVKSKNRTGLPDNLKTGIENLSGYNMDYVQVHYNSSKPAQLHAHAYTQGTDIYIAPGQEKHLPHEAWHVVQQMQGRVQPTTQLHGVNINDNEGLEREADVMGERIMQRMVKSSNEQNLNYKNYFYNNTVVQRGLNVEGFGEVNEENIYEFISIIPNISECETEDIDEITFKDLENHILELIQDKEQKVKHVADIFDEAAVIWDVKKLSEKIKRKDATDFHSTKQKNIKRWKKYITDRNPNLFTDGRGEYYVRLNFIEDYEQARRISKEVKSRIVRSDGHYYGFMFRK